ncbi:MAG: glycine--tRNA ligase [Desulfurococcales archaeon]|nr:glycine--tRNA ligase [Desulfurococcales archaeon]
MGEDLYSKVVELARRRGFFWPSYEIYGGVAGFYDFGPYGVLLKRKIIEKWRRFIVKNHSNYVVEIESPIIGPSRVYEASGHVENFTDPIVTCLKCGRKFRADHLIEEKLGIDAEGLSPDEMTDLIRKHGIRCPVCGGELGEVKLFNLLFPTQIGPYEGNRGYIRPELAQGMFVAFKRVLDVMRGRLPLGIAQIGRVGRNEISPRQAMMRLREFTIMEMEYFIDPEDEDGSCPFYDNVKGEVLRIRTYEAKTRGEGPREYRVDEAVENGVIIHKCLAYWMVIGKRFMNSLGVPDEAMFFDEKGPHERAHYSSQTFDQMVKVSRWGWVEVAGHSYRGSYDLSRHMEYSGADLTVFKPYEKPREVKVKKAFIDKAYIGRTFKSEAKRILEEASRIPVERLVEAAEKGEPVEEAGHRIPPEAIKVVERTEKVSGRKIIPHVVEPSFGTDRIVYVAFEYAYREKAGRTVLSFPRDIAPIEAGVLPLVEKEESLREKALGLYHLLVENGFHVVYDDSGSIGRRYARLDEIGVPAVFTVDYQTLEDDTVTLRDRDTWRQVRVPLKDAPAILRKFLYGGVDIVELGTPVEGTGQDTEAG